MKKAAGHISGILKGILCIGFSIRIILGIIWMCFNFTHLQDFQQETGILYRCLVYLGVGKEWLLYGFQLAAAYFAADRFLQKIHPTGLFWRVWGNLVLLTFPMAMQCHLAISPCSLVSSFFLLELSAVVTAVRNTEEDTMWEYAKAGCCWLVLALLLPEYFILGFAPLLLAILFRLPSLFKQIKRLLYAILMLLAFGGMIVGIHALTGEASYILDKESVAFSLFSRTAWPTIWHDREGWPTEVKAVTDESVWEVSLYADNMQRIFRPLMQEHFSDQQSADYYLEMAAFSFRQHMPLIIRQIGGDALGYGVTSLILPMQLRGKGYASYSGRNYEFMFMNSPVVTKMYVNYSCWWFAAALLLMALLTAVELLGHSVKLKRRGMGAVILCLISAGAVVAAYTLRGAGVMDYKCTVAVNLLWSAAALLIMGMGSTACIGEGENSEETEKMRI